MSTVSRGYGGRGGSQIRHLDEASNRKPFCSSFRGPYLSGEDLRDERALTHLRGEGEAEGVG